MNVRRVAVCAVSLGIGLIGAGRTALADDDAAGASAERACCACQAVGECDDFPCGPSYLPAPLRVLIIQEFGGADFRPACRAHDRCYDSASSRQCCDAAFEANLMQACESSWLQPGCQFVAGSMALSVRLFGTLSK